MDETIIFPSPNWFQVSGVAVSRDGWLIYGGPSKSLCILKPVNPDDNGFLKGSPAYQAHVVNRAHFEKIVSVDISKEWPEKKLVLTGSADGFVKQWSLENVKNAVRVVSTHSHDIHYNDKEEIAGLGYSTDVFAITVGCFGNLVKWDLKSNVVKTYNQFLKGLKPTCLSCSQHLPLNVAVGTKQGLVIVLDLNGQGKIVYKVRGQDDEIINLSWCPQYEITLKKTLKESKQRPSLTDRLEKIRSQDNCEESLNNSGISKELPDDSFDESIVQEDDMFDIYKDHEADEFGHKKFEPTDIIVKIKEESAPGDFLAECLKLKQQILNNKNDTEPSIATLVDALDKTHVDVNKSSGNRSSDKVESDVNEETHKNKVEPQIKNKEESSSHIHKHLLATVGKYGGVRLWSKSGKLVASCVVPNAANKNQRNKGPVATTLLWYKADVLLIADGKSQMLECNPLKIDCKNKLDWQIVHTLHKRGLYCIVTNAPRVQTDEHTQQTRETQHTHRDTWVVWTVAQDRNMVCYSLERKEKIATYNTCGGFLYNIRSCPYDAKKIAVSAGDGAIRVWETDTLEEDDTKLSLGHVTSFWQNVQGKVLTIAWHPTRENLLAFGTAEARVGLIDTSGRSERPAKTLVPVLRSGVYSLTWGQTDKLYACGGGVLVVYTTDRIDRDPVPIKVQFEGKDWELSSVAWDTRGMLCGSNNGAVAVLDPDTYQLITASFLFGKMIHSTEWHPLQTSSSSEESTYKDLIAISSLDKQCNIILVQFTDKGDGPKLHMWKTLTGHKATVLQLSWNPHNDLQLLSTSYDSTVRVWDVSSGSCSHVFWSHSQASLSVSWCGRASVGGAVSGGADCSLRLWRLTGHEPENYTEIIHDLAPKNEKKNKNKSKKTTVQETETLTGNIAASLDTKVLGKVTKKFLLPMINRQTTACTIHNVKKMVQKYLSRNIKSNEELDNTEASHVVEETKVIEENIEKDVEKVEKNVEEVEKDVGEVDFTKIFGNTNDVNEVLDMEMHAHLQYGRFESWVVVCVCRGVLDVCVREAVARTALCPFLVSLTPGVSNKFWKEVTKLYLAQIDNMVAKGTSEKLYENKQYGGPIYRKVSLLLSVHDVKAALDTLLEARLHKEAYVLARVRHMDSIAKDILKQWALDSLNTGQLCMAAVCYLALEDPYAAALTLSKSNEQELLLLASELAKESGHPTFANHIEDKKTQILNETPETDNQDLKTLPSKIDLMKESIQVSQEIEDVYPVPIKVQFEGKDWELSSVAWDTRGMLCGSNNGAVWDVSSGSCSHVFWSHSQASLSVSWCGRASVGGVVSGGADCSLRLWRLTGHEPENYTEIIHDLAPKNEKKNKNKSKKTTVQETETLTGNIAASLDTKVLGKVTKKFLLPMINRQTTACTIHIVKKMVQKYLSRNIKSNEELDNTEASHVVEETKVIEENIEKDVEKVEKNVEEVEKDVGEVDFTKIFGNTNDVNEVLDMEMHAHLQYGRFESWVVVCVCRGVLDVCVREAVARTALCPFLVSLTPGVSNKFWKDVTKLYLAQIDNMVAKGTSEKLYENKQYGGPIYRKVSLLLSVHDVKAALDTLLEARLHKEAYVLARVRHMDSIAKDILKQWALDSLNTGQLCMAAVCYLALEDPYAAALTLSKSNEQELLLLASELAKESGHPTFANHIEDKKTQILNETPETDNQDLKTLPSKIDLMKESIQVSQEIEDV